MTTTRRRSATTTRRRSPNGAAPLVVDRRALARLFGCSLRHVTELEAERVIVPLRRGRGGRPSTYALDAAVPAYLRRMTEAPTSGAEREARARRDRAQARLTELRIAKEEGALVSREDVVLAGQALLKGLQAQIRALPRRLVQAGVLDPAREAAAAALLRELQIEIARWTTLADAERAARASGDAAA